MRKLLPLVLVAFLAGCGGARVSTRTAPKRFGVTNVIPLSQKGAANGVATLNGSSQLTGAQVPPSLATKAEAEGKLAKAENLKDLASASTARTNLGLGSAAVEAASAFDAAGTSAAGVKVEKERAEAAEVLKAPLASPVLTGAPKAPTAPPKTNTEQLATTAFAQTVKTEGEAGSKTTSEAEVKVERERAETAEATKAPLASPTLTGTPAAPTATAKTNTTQLATTAFVQTALAEVETLVEGKLTTKAELVSGRIPESELPLTVEVNRKKALGTISAATQELNLEEGNYFTATLEYAGEVVFKIGHAPARPVGVTLVLKYGSHSSTWSVEGASWVAEKPTYSNAEGAKAWAGLAVTESGAEITGFGAVKGATGPEGKEGKQGPEGKEGKGAEAPLEWHTLEEVNAKVENYPTEVEGSHTPSVACSINGQGMELLTGVWYAKEAVAAKSKIAVLPTSCGHPTHTIPLNFANIEEPASDKFVYIKTNGEIINTAEWKAKAAPLLEGKSFSKEH